MDINELQSFRLSDAVKFHDKLNPALWTKQDKLQPQVQKQLLIIAQDFIDYLGLSDLKVKDITISGSNAAYSYTPHSDIDLHILVDFKDLPNDEVYQELFSSKKTLYNDIHEITVHGVPVELYVQDTNQKHTSLGEYSVLNNDWVKFPIKRRANLSQTNTKLKYEKLGEMIELAIESRDFEKIKKVLDILKRYRRAGLDKTGEFGPENLAYKLVRQQGLLQRLIDVRNELHSERLSIEEQLDVPIPTVDDLLSKYGEKLVMNQLRTGIKTELEHTNDIKTAMKIALAHLGENIYYYTLLSKAGLEESASGYIPSNAEKDDPRYKTALTVDIKPDTMRRNAKKLGWKISRSGIPPLLRK